MTEPVKILIVEDHLDARRAMVLLLKRSGYEVADAGTVAEGIAKVDGQSIALLDLTLPDGSGIEVLNHIRKQRHVTRVAIISIAFDVPTEMLTPVDAVFRKPMDFDKLLGWIKSGS